MKSLILLGIQPRNPIDHFIGIQRKMRIDSDAIKDTDAIVHLADTDVALASKRWTSKWKERRWILGKYH